MKSQKFPTQGEAVAYLNEHEGELKYWGREGVDAKTYVYTLTIGNIVYHLLVNSGDIRVMDQRYK